MSMCDRVVKFELAPSQCIIIWSITSSNQRLGSEKSLPSITIKFMLFISIIMEHEASGSLQQSSVKIVGSGFLRC